MSQNSYKPYHSIIIIIVIVHSFIRFDNIMLIEFLLF